MSARLWQAYRGGFQGKPGYWLHFEYDEDALKVLKRYKNGEQRAWDQEEKRWWISVDIAEQVAGAIPQLQAFLRQRPLL